MSKLFDLKGKTAVITGGLGQLGTQYVKTLLEAGAKVAVFDINCSKLNDYFRSQSGNSSLKLYEVDIANKDQIVEAAKAVIRDLGIPGILVNNAALDVPPGSKNEESGPFEDYPERSLDLTYAVNIKGMVFCCQVIGRVMAENGGGSIINISSIYGNVSPDQRIYAYRTKKTGKEFYKPVTYSITKSAVLNLTRYLATYWSKKNVRVNTLSLGGVFNNQEEEFLNGYNQKVPLGRMAREDEYNGAVLYLASDASSYMTGSNVVIDGGLTAW